MNRNLNRSLGLASLLLLCMSIALLETNVMLNAEIAFFSAPQAEQGMTLKAGKDNIFFCLGSGTFPLMNDALLNDQSIHLTISEFKSQDVKQVVSMYRSAAERLRIPALPSLLSVFEKGKLYDVFSDRDLTFKCNTGLSALSQPGAFAAPSNNLPPPSQPVIVDRSNASAPSSQQTLQPAVTQKPAATSTSTQHPLFLTLNDPTSFVKKGDVIIMVLEMKNIGQVQLDRVFFAISLPDGYEIPAGAATGKCLGNGSQVACTDFSLGENQSLSFSFPFVVKENAACGKTTVRATGNGLPQGSPALSATQSNIATWSVDCPGSSAPAESSAASSQNSSITTISSAAASSAASSVATVPTITSVSPQNEKISVEMSGLSAVKTPGSMDITMKIKNKTASALNNVSFFLPARFSGNGQVEASPGCAIIGSNVICSNIIIPAGSAYTVTMRYPVTFDDCGNQPFVQSTVQKANTSGTVDVSLATTLRWQWDCSGTTQSNNWAQISGNPPAHVLADTPFGWNMTVRNTVNGAINYWLSMAIPDGATYDPMPGCGQSGPNLSCGGDVLSPNQSQNTTIGKLTFPKSMCGQDVPLGKMRAINALGGGVVVVMGETAPLTVHVDCASTTTQTSSTAASVGTTAGQSSAVVIDNASASSRASSLSNQPLSIILSGPAALQKNTSATYGLAIKNTSSLNLQNVSFNFAFPTGISTDSVSNSPNCTISASGMSCTNFGIQPGLGLNLTLPIKTLSTLPCADFPVKVTVNAIGMIMESNTITVKGCSGESNELPTTLLTSIAAPQGFLPKNTAQSMLINIVTSKNGFADGTLHVTLPTGMSLQNPVNSFNAGTCTVTENAMDCVGITRDPSKSVIYTLPFFVTDSTNCGANEYTATFSYLENGVRKEIVKNQGVQLCTAATTNSGPVNQFAITTGISTCATSDCRTVTIPVTLKNMSPNTATNVLVTAKLDDSWTSGSMNGAACQIVDTPEGRMFDCPGGPYLTIPAQTNLSYSLTLTTSAPCPISPARTAVLLQSAPASVYEKDYSDNSVYATIPAPCPSVTTGTSGGSAAGTDTHTSSAATTGGGIGGTNPQPIVLRSITVTGNSVTVDYQKNTQSCAHLLNGDLQIVHTQNSFCNANGPAVVPLAQMNVLFGVGKTFMLCDGNDNAICSSPVTVEQNIVDASGTDSVSISQEVPGMNGNTCLDADCTRVLLPVSLRNTSAAEAKNIRMSVTADASWASATLMGLPCTLNTSMAYSTVKDTKTFDCQGITVAGNKPLGLNMGMVLTRSAKCPVQNFQRNTTLQLTPGTLFALANTHSAIVTLLPLPCQSTAASASSTSSAQINTDNACDMNPAFCSSSSKSSAGNGTVPICSDYSNTDADCSNNVLSLDSVDMVTQKGWNATGTLSVTIKTKGAIDPATQMVYVKFAAPYDFLSHGQGISGTNQESFQLNFGTTYYPTIEITQRDKFMQTHFIFRKKLDPVTIAPPPTAFSTKEHYGMFVSNVTVSGNMAVLDATGKIVKGRAGADALCNLSAQQAGISPASANVWHAMLNNPHKKTFPLYNMRNELLAQTEEDLWNLQRNALPATITNAVGDDVYGYAWTGSDGTGKIATANCNGWSTNLMPATGSIGQINGGGGMWYQSGLQSCPQSAYVYCINDLTQ